MGYATPVKGWTFERTLKKLSEGPLGTHATIPGSVIHKLLDSGFALRVRVGFQKRPCLVITPQGRDELKRQASAQS